MLVELGRSRDQFLHRSVTRLSSSSFSSSSLYPLPKRITDVPDQRRILVESVRELRSGKRIVDIALTVVITLLGDPNAHSEFRIKYGQSFCAERVINEWIV